MTFAQCYAPAHVMSALSVLCQLHGAVGIFVRACMVLFILVSDTAI